MIKKQIGEWIIGNDAEATREMYKTMIVGRASSSKSYKKFVKLVPKFPKEVLEFFKEHGVDIKMPCSIEEAKFGKQKCYSGHYYLVGHYFEGKEIWLKQESTGAEYLDEEGMYPLIGGYKIAFTKDLYNVPAIKDVPSIKLLHMEISFLIEK